MRLRLDVGTALVAFIALAQSAAAQSGACDRECLRGFITRYLNAMVAHQPSDVPVASNFRFTEDGAAVPLGQGRLWSNASRLRDYRLDILDVREAVAASFAIVEEAGKPVMLALRLKIVSGKITEAETQVTRDKTEGSLFKPEALRSPNGAMLLMPFLDQRNSRDQMIKIAEMYPAGLKAGSFVTVDVPFAPDAYRFENGQLMAGPGCKFLAGCENIKSQKIPTLASTKYRVVAVDEEQSIVLLRMDFGSGSSFVQGDSLVVWEAFKVYGGQIHAVEAFMKNMPLGTPSGWESSAEK